MIVAKTAVREKGVGVGWSGERVLLTGNEVGGRGGGNLHRCLKRICGFVSDTDPGTTEAVRQGAGTDLGSSQG